MIDNPFQYVAAFYRQDGSSVGMVPFAPDREPLEGWARLAAIRSGALSPGASAFISRIEPVWDRLRGRPHLGGLSIDLFLDGERVFARALPPYYLSALAQAISPALVNRGLLKEGDYFTCLFLAYPGKGEPGVGGGFQVERIRPSLNGIRSCIEDYKERSRPVGPEAQDDDLPVFLPDRILEEARSLAKEAGSMETGGMLLGRLMQDSNSPELFLEITGLIPAEHTRSELTRLTFTPETWRAAHRERTRRDRGEILAGWFHSHSFMKETCKDCEHRSSGACRSDAAFLSAEDHRLHRTCFSAPYSLALVVADNPTCGVTEALFGWRCAVIQPRGFNLLDPGPCPAEIGGTPYAP